MNRKVNRQKRRLFEVVLILVIFASFFLANALPRSTMAETVQAQIATAAMEGAEQAGAESPMLLSR